MSKKISNLKEHLLCSKDNFSLQTFILKTGYVIVIAMKLEKTWFEGIQEAS